jgi:hypothetical protein
MEYRKTSEEERVNKFYDSIMNDADYSMEIVEKNIKNLKQTIANDLGVPLEEVGSSQKIETAIRSLCVAARRSGELKAQREILSEGGFIAAEDHSLHQSGNEFKPGKYWFYVSVESLRTVEKRLTNGYKQSEHLKKGGEYGA